MKFKWECVSACFAAYDGDNFVVELLAYQGDTGGWLAQARIRGVGVPALVQAQTDAIYPSEAAAKKEAERLGSALRKFAMGDLKGE
jgi:hypothetical protein